MIEVVASSSTLHVAYDTAWELWRRSMRTLCGRHLGDVPSAKRGDKPSCRQCKRILESML